MKQVIITIVMSLLMISSLKGQLFFSDDFEGGVSGEQVHCSGAEGWTTWLNNPCTNVDPYYSSEESFMGENSMRVREGNGYSNDILYLIDDYTSGKYIIDFWILIKEGKHGYWNAAHKIVGSSYYFAIRSTYYSDSFKLQGPDFNIFTSYEQGVWMHEELWVDLDTDIAFFVHNDELIASWQWSLNSINQLSSLNFCGISNSDFLIDNFSIVQVSSFSTISNLIAQVGENYNDIHLTWTYDECNDFNFYNVYRAVANADFELIGSTVTNSFDDTNLPDGTYYYKVAPVCGGTEWVLSNSVEVEISPPTGVERELSDFVSFYPNPTNGILHIQSDVSLDREVEIINMIGKTVFQKTIRGSNETLNLSDFECGVYFIRIKSDGKVFTSKFIKK